jgi:hypothetical protein
LGLNLGWVYLFMGVLIGSAVLPLWNLMTWNLASGKGAVIAAWSGMILAFAGWIAAAYIQSGKITVATLGSEEVMLSGNLIAIISSGFIHFVYSKFVDPVVFDFDTLNDNIHLVEQDLSGLSAAERDKTMIHKTKKWIQTRGYLLTFVLILLWPLCSVPAKLFTKSYFSFWVLLSIAWGFGAALTIAILPLYESSDDIYRVIAGITGMGGGSEDVVETSAVETDAATMKAKELTSSDDVDEEFLAVLQSTK